MKIIVKELQDGKYVLRDNALHSVESNPAKEIPCVDQYETLETTVKHRRLAVEISNGASTEIENRNENDEIRKPKDTSSENNSQKPYQKGNGTYQAEANTEDDCTSSPKSNVNIHVGLINPHTKDIDNNTEVQAITENVSVESDTALDLSTTNNRKMVEKCSKPERENER